MIRCPARKGECCNSGLSLSFGAHLSKRERILKHSLPRIEPHRELKYYQCCYVIEQEGGMTSGHFQMKKRRTKEKKELILFSEQMDGSGTHTAKSPRAVS